jgi:phosphoglycerate dehydrogenase-like enzyme
MTEHLRIHIENDSTIGPLFEITPEMIARAEARRPEVKGRWSASYGHDLVEFGRNVAAADGLLGWQFRHAEIDRLGPRLRWIQLTGAGLDHLLPLTWLPPRIALTNARGAHKPKIGEALFMSVLMLNNFIPALVHHQRARRWNQMFATGIAGKTLLIVGLGEAGGDAARLARTFGMRVVATARRTTSHIAAHEVHSPAALHDLLPQADIVMLTVPLTPQTRGMFGTREIALMKPGAGLVSLARAGIVDDVALKDALARGHLSGCVYDLEDPSHRQFDTEMWDCPNMIYLPHSQTNDPARFMENVLDIFFDNLARTLGGEPFANRVDPDLGY